MKTSKSKTFQKGDDFYEVYEWLMKDQFGTDDYQPEGTDWSGGEPGPHDPKALLKHKYIVYIVQVTEDKPKEPVELTCPGCGALYKTTHGKLYCSRSCYHSAYRRKNRKKISGWQAEYRIRKKFEATQSPIYAPH